MSELLNFIIENLASVMAAVAAGTATVPIVTFIIQRTPNDYFETSSQRRMLALALSFVLGIGAQLALIFAGIIPTPVDGNAWVESLVPVMTAAYAAGQIAFSTAFGETFKAGVLAYDGDGETIRVNE